MKTTRKLGAAILVASLFTGLAACSSTDDSGPVELVIWDTGLLGKTNDDGSAADNSFLDNAAKQFEEENPDVTVTVVQQGGDLTANQAQFEAASIAGNGPDIRVQFAGGPTLDFSDYLVDLDGVLSDDVMNDLTGWNTVREGYASDGKLLAMPYGAGTYFTVFVNHKLLEDAGMDPSVVPATWEDLMAQGAEYQAKTGDSAFWVADLEGYVGAWVVAALAGGYGGTDTFTDMYSGATQIDGEAMLKAYQAWADLYASGLTNPDAGEVSNGDSTAGFLDGKGAWYIVGMWEDSNMEANFGDDVSSYWIPMLADAPYQSVAAGGPQVAISITSYSEHQDVAAQFLDFLAQPEIQDQYVATNQTEASNSRSADASVITSPLLQSQAEQLQTTEQLVYPFDNVMPNSVIDLFYRLNASVFLGTVTPEDAVAQLQAAYDAEQ